MSTTTAVPDTSTIASQRESFSLKLIVLSGRSGSGKSSTAFEICHILRSSEIMNIHIDGDNLNTLYPCDNGSDLAMQNLKALWPQYWVAATQYWTKSDRMDMMDRELVVVISGTAMVLNASRIREILDSGIVNTHVQTGINADNLSVSMYRVLLETKTECIRQRLKKREIGGELDAHLKSSDKMADVLNVWKSEQIADTIVVDSSARDVHEIASEILGRCNIGSK